MQVPSYLLGSCTVTLLNGEFVLYILLTRYHCLLSAMVLQVFNKYYLFYILLFQKPGRDSSYLELMKNASLWLIRTDFAFEYPRPLMPNVKFIGGFHCKPAKQLPKVLISNKFDTYEFSNNILI